MPLVISAESALEECAPIIENYQAVGLDSTAIALTHKLGMDKVGDYDKFKKAINGEIKIDKSDKFYKMAVEKSECKAFDIWLESQF